MHACCTFERSWIYLGEKNRIFTIVDRYSICFLKKTSTWLHIFYRFFSDFLSFPAKNDLN